MAKRPSAPRSGRAAYAPDFGHVVTLDFDPTRGTEMGKRRPALVLTPASYNRLVGRCFACPITSTVRGYPFEVAMQAGQKVQGVALADQGRPVDWRARHAAFAEAAPQPVIDEVRAKLRAFLQF